MNGVAKPWNSFPEPDRNVVYLYAIQFQDGIIKIGRTAFVKERVRAFELSGKTPIKFKALKTVNGSHNELEFIRRVGRIGNVCRGRREHFTDVKFGSVVTLLRQVAPRKLIQNRKAGIWFHPYKPEAEKTKS